MLWNGNECGKKTKVMRISRQPCPLQIMMDQKELENVGYFNCSGSLIINAARYTSEVKSRIVMATAAFSKKKALFTKSEFKEETDEMLHLEHNFV
jgi:hypothetical protein